MEGLSDDSFTFSSMSDSSDISDMSDCESVLSDISDMSDIHSNKLIKGGMEAKEKEEAERLAKEKAEKAEQLAKKATQLAAKAAAEKAAQLAAKATQLEEKALEHQQWPHHSSVSVDEVNRIAAAAREEAAKAAEEAEQLAAKAAKAAPAEEAAQLAAAEAKAEAEKEAERLAAERPEAERPEATEQTKEERPEAKAKAAQLAAAAKAAPAEEAEQLAAKAAEAKAEAEKEAERLAAERPEAERPEATEQTKEERPEAKAKADAAAAAQADADAAAAQLAAEEGQGSAGIEESTGEPNPATEGDAEAAAKKAAEEAKEAAKKAAKLEEVAAKEAEEAKALAEKIYKDGVQELSYKDISDRLSNLDSQIPDEAKALKDKEKILYNLRSYQDKMINKKKFYSAYITFKEDEKKAKFWGIMPAEAKKLANEIYKNYFEVSYKDISHHLNNSGLMKKHIEEILFKLKSHKMVDRDQFYKAYITFNYGVTEDLERINNEFLEYLNSSIFEINFRKKLIEKKRGEITDEELDVFIKENIYQLVSVYNRTIAYNKSFFDVLGNKKHYIIILCTNSNNYLRIGLICNAVKDNFMPIEGRTADYITISELQKKLDEFVLKKTEEAKENKEYMSIKEAKTEVEAYAIGLSLPYEYVRRKGVTLARNTVTRLITVDEVDRSTIYKNIEDDKYKLGLSVYKINVDN